MGIAWITLVVVTWLAASGLILWSYNGFVDICLNSWGNTAKGCLAVGTFVVAVTEGYFLFLTVGRLINGHP